MAPGFIDSNFILNPLAIYQGNLEDQTAILMSRMDSLYRGSRSS